MDRKSFVEDCTSKIIEMAVQNNISVPYNAIELFGGNGDIYTKYLAKKCNHITGFDIDSYKEQNFLKNIPNGTFVCENIIDTLNNDGFHGFDDKYNIISIDNPLSIYGDNGQYCEHFNFINNVYKLVKLKSVIAFNIIRKPYNFEQNSEWNRIRADFYSMNNDYLDLDDTKSFYDVLFDNQGVKVNNSVLVCRELDNDLDYFYMYIGCVDRKNDESSD